MFSISMEIKPVISFPINYPLFFPTHKKNKITNIQYKKIKKKQFNLIFPPPSFKKLNLIPLHTDAN